MGGALNDGVGAEIGGELSAPGLAVDFPGGPAGEAFAFGTGQGKGSALDGLQIEIGEQEPEEIGHRNGGCPGRCLGGIHGRAAAEEEILEPHHTPCPGGATGREGRAGGRSKRGNGGNAKVGELAIARMVIGNEQLEVEGLAEVEVASLADGLELFPLVDDEAEPVAEGKQFIEGGGEVRMVVQGDFVKGRLARGGIAEAEGAEAIDDGLEHDGGGMEGGLGGRNHGSGGGAVLGRFRAMFGMGRRGSGGFFGGVKIAVISGNGF